HRRLAGGRRAARTRRVSRGRRRPLRRLPRRPQLLLRARTALAVRALLDAPPRARHVGRGFSAPPRWARSPEGGGLKATPYVKRQVPVVVLSGRWQSLQAFGNASGTFGFPLHAAGRSKVPAGASDPGPHS